MDRTTYFQTLRSDLNQINEQVAAYQKLSEDQLRTRPAEGKWHVLDCIDHLNRTYALYLPRIAKAVEKAKKGQKGNYRSGMLLPMMINSLKPKNGKAGMKMKTFKFMEPQTESRSTKEVFEEFREQRKQLDQLVATAQHTSLNQVRITSAVGPMLRFRLGDCFRFLATHDQRHLVQCENVLKATK